MRLLRTEKCGSAKLAEYLNCFFQSVFVRDEENETTPVFAARTNHYCNYDVNLMFNCEDLMSKQEKLGVSKAISVDGVSPVLLKKCAADFASSLLIVFGKSFEEGIIPVEWKVANVTPIFKERDGALLSNYRPAL